MEYLNLLYVHDLFLYIYNLYRGVLWTLSKTVNSQKFSQKSPIIDVLEYPKHAILYIESKSIFFYFNSEKRSLLNFSGYQLETNTKN